jgi:hypothetical protein
MIEWVRMVPDSHSLSTIAYFLLIFLPADKRGIEATIAYVAYIQCYGRIESMR